MKIYRSKWLSLSVIFALIMVMGLMVGDSSGKGNKGGKDSTPPTVTAVLPADGATDVAVSTNVSITFLEPMDTESVEAAFSLADGGAVSGTFTWSDDDTVMTFNPSSDLAYSTTYTITVDTTAEDISGNNLENTFTSTFTTTTPPTAERELFVANYGSNTISVFDATFSGDISPLKEFGGLAELNDPQGVAVDTVNDEILVANNGDRSIKVYSRTATGDVAPLRTISGPGTALYGLCGIAVDTVNDEIIVAKCGSLSNYGGDDAILVYSRTDGILLRSISGSRTGIDNPLGVAVDTVNNEIIVANNAGGTNYDSILVYRRTADGDVAPIRTITGANTGLRTPHDVAVDTVNNEIIVVTDTIDGLNLTYSIHVYRRTADGDVAPLRTTGEGLNEPYGIAVDTVNDEILVANNRNSITVYSRRRLSLLRVITTGRALYGLNGIAVDTVNDEIIVSESYPWDHYEGDSIFVYSRTADGEVPPLRTIGNITKVSKPVGITVDTVNDEILVANSEDRAIRIYSILADGPDTTPLRSIFSRLDGITDVAVDTVNDEILVTGHYDAGYYDPGDDWYFEYRDFVIRVYSRTDGTLLRIIITSTTTDESDYSGKVTGIVVDTENDEIIVARYGNNSILVYSLTAEGAVDPIRTISGAGTGLNEPYFITLDPVNGEIIVANRGNSSITVYDRLADGDAAPIRTIAGASTGIVDPSGVAVDTESNELFVGDWTNNTIQVYSRTADGNVAPLRVIQGPNTGLSTPAGIAVTW